MTPDRCEMISGNDGTAYIKVNYDTNYYIYTVLGGAFPDTTYTDTYYEVTEGTYSSNYVLYYLWEGWEDFDYDEVDEYWYCIYTNADFMTCSTDSYTSALSYFVNNYFSTYHIVYDYTVSVNQGTPFFQDGADLYYDLYLGWDLSDSGILSYNTTPMKSVAIESSAEKVVKEYTDGRYTIRLETRKNVPSTGLKIVVAQ